MLMQQEECSPGAKCWPEGPAAVAGGPASAPELEAIAIMLCIISGDMLDITELTLFIISGDTLMPAASRDLNIIAWEVCCHVHLQPLWQSMSYFARLCDVEEEKQSHSTAWASSSAVRKQQISGTVLLSTTHWHVMLSGHSK